MKKEQLNHLPILFFLTLMTLAFNFGCSSDATSTGEQLSFLCSQNDNQSACEDDGCVWSGNSCLSTYIHSYRCETIDSERSCKSNFDRDCTWIGGKCRENISCLNNQSRSTCEEWSYCVWSTDKEDGYCLYTDSSDGAVCQLISNSDSCKAMRSACRWSGSKCYDVRASCYVRTSKLDCQESNSRCVWSAETEDGYCFNTASPDEALCQIIEVPASCNAMRRACHWENGVCRPK